MIAAFWINGSTNMKPQTAGESASRLDTNFFIIEAIRLDK
jgi:hypothetical protein